MEIRIYIEGGGDGKETKRQLRIGFSSFLDELRSQAQEKRIRWNIIACGTRRHAYENFMLAQKTRSDAFNVLLVDSEGPVSSLPWKHLAARDGWETDELLDNQYHLMVQVMEAWFMADKQALQRFYGDNFNINSLPRRADIENINKVTIYNALSSATRNTQKGKYEEIRHGAKLLGLIDPARVRHAAPNCRRLFDILSETIKHSNN